MLLVQEMYLGEPFLASLSSVAGHSSITNMHLCVSRAEMMLKC